MSQTSNLLIVSEERESKPVQEEKRQSLSFEVLVIFSFYIGEDQSKESAITFRMQSLAKHEKKRVDELTGGSTKKRNIHFIIVHI